MNGKSIITGLGLKALRDASLHNREVMPKYFKFSSNDIELDTKIESEDIDGWIKQDINLYQVLDDNTVEFICDVEPTKATSYAVVCGLYLEDGTLFMVAKPPYPFPPQARQTLKIQFVFQNALNVLDFKYLPFSEEEQSLSALDTALTFGSETIDFAEEEGLNKKRVEEISEDILFLKERANADKQKINTLFGEIENLQVCVFENSLSLGIDIIGSSEEIGLLKK